MISLPQTLLVLWVILILWKISQPPDDNDKGGGMLQPIYVRK
jgi:hypothetical protein